MVRAQTNPRLTESRCLRSVWTPMAASSAAARLDTLEELSPAWKWTSVRKQRITAMYDPLSLLVEVHAGQSFTPRSSLNGMQETADCMNVDGSFLCTCIPGFAGGVEPCTNVDECLENSACHVRRPYPCRVALTP